MNFNEESNLGNYQSGGLGGTSTYMPYVTAEEVSRILNKSRSSAYRIINSLNDELVKEGFKVTSGRVSRVYFEKRFYGLKGE